MGSILLHILLFFMWTVGAMLNLFSAPAPELVPDPIVFQLQDTPRQKPRQVVETPDDAEVTKDPKDADYLSDKNALARNENALEDLALGKAFAVGDLNAAELPTPRGPRGNQGAVARNSEVEKQQGDQKDGSKEQSEALFERLSASDFHRADLVKPSNPQPPGQQNSSMRARYDNQKSRALKNGGVSFNTYDWDFAPYMLWLKRRVEQNIFPPPAYTRMGMIQGETLLRFRIYPDGKMENLQVLKYKGHKTLMETSYRAIEISAPFKNLPADFPEPFLEVTAVFTYTIR